MLKICEDFADDHDIIFNASKTQFLQFRSCSNNINMKPVLQMQNGQKILVWICGICHKQIHVRKQISIRCNRIEHWVNLRCAGIRQAQYTYTWTCHLHR